MFFKVFRDPYCTVLCLTDVFVYEKLDMPPTLSLEEKIEIVLIVGDKYKTFREAADIFNFRHPDKNIHNETVRKIFNKFKACGDVHNKFGKKRQSMVENNDIALQVMLSATEHPKYPLRKRASSLPMDIKKSTVSKILNKHKYHPYKPKKIHTLRPGDNDRRFEFCCDIQGILVDNPFMSRCIIFTDEATFSSNGTVSSQNCRWWSDTNPHFTLKTRDQYSFKTNVWCGMYKNQIIGPFFFRETLNADRYLCFLNNRINDFLDNLPLLERHQIWFQQDGAPCHSRLDVRQYIENIFNGRVFHRFSEIPWPPRSPDLTPLDFFLWGYLKQKVYLQRPFQDVDHLERIIAEAVSNITPHMVSNVLREFCNRTVTCINRNGGYVEALVN